MEIRNNSNVVLKQGSNPNFEKSRKELARNLDIPKGSVFDWKNFDIKDIAEINVGSNKRIILKAEKVDDKGRKFMEVNGRKYYEFNGNGTPEKSFYLHKGGALFLGNKLDGLNIWEGVSFRCLHESMESFLLEQRETRYSGGAMHLGQLFKSEIFPSGESVSTINRKGRRVKVTRNLVEKYLDGSISDSSRHMVEDAIKSDPDFLAYVESLNR